MDQKYGVQDVKVLQGVNSKTFEQNGENWRLANQSDMLKLNQNSGTYTWATDPNWTDNLGFDGGYASVNKKGELVWHEIPNYDQGLAKVYLKETKTPIILN